MHITDIERLPGKKNRIYIDDEYAFMLYDRDMAVYNIGTADMNETGEGIGISDELYERIMKETVIRRARQKCVAMLERMDRTEDELRKKLKFEMYPETVISDTIEWLKGLHYVDDGRYAMSYIRTRLDSTSRQALISKLLMKGISRDIIDEAYSACCEEIGFIPGQSRNKREQKITCGTESAGEDESAEQQAATATLRKKLGGKQLLTYKERMSIIGYMMRKGFRRREIQAAFEALSITIGDYDIPE
ncbi:MAG: RecX family transcriptional regulator [Lachnospiraceae bacterium]|nr:RecX family transcriptional regulator [Lachnospiraceae bacterium]